MKPVNPRRAIRVRRALIALLGWALLLPAMPARGELPVIGLNAGIHMIRAEIANTFETRARGLMYRKSLAPNQGMLFVFSMIERHCMWMKNTPLPLSVAFIDEGGEIVSISDMAPHKEDSHCAARPARYALEMKRGWFAGKGIRPGSKLGGLDKAPTAR